MSYIFGTLALRFALYSELHDGGKSKILPNYVQNLSVDPGRDLLTPIYQSSPVRMLAAQTLRPQQRFSKMLSSRLGGKCALLTA